VARSVALTGPGSDPDSTRRRQYLWLWVFGLALGFFEAAIVVYLRALYYPEGFRFPLVVITGRIASVEIAREAASIAVLGAAARLAATRFLERFAAFLLLFGVWDLSYYADLKLLLGWPESLSTWDVLFLIPVIWTGPVWAPCLISATLVGVGSYLFLTPDRPRSYRPLDWAVVIAAGLLVILSFTAESRAVLEGGVPRDFPLWLFGAGWSLGVLWFFRAERRFRREPAFSRPGIGATR
jgi:hypothetical protein